MAEENNWARFIENYKERILAIFTKDGICGVNRFVHETLDQWKKVPLNIAVTGNSGTGKSSFINTLKGTFADDEDGAKADVVQCTENPTPYQHPTNKNLIIWDLPGVGTPKLPKETYLAKMDFERYDLFIIISASRFTENDLWLAKAIGEMNVRLEKDDRKPFYFVRSKIDNDLLSHKKSHRNPETKDNTLKRIKEEIKNELMKENFENTPIYLIENYEKDKYDFGLLTNRIVLESPAEKREAMALSLTLLTESLIDAKELAFKERMWKICMASACGGAVPIPGFSAVIDGALLIREASLYREQFGLNEEGLKRSARLLHIPLDDLRKTLGLKTPGIVLTVRGIMAICSGVVFSEYIESTVKFTIPVLGSLIAGGASYYSTQFMLKKLLDVMVNDARKIQKHIKEKLQDTGA